MWSRVHGHMSRDGKRYPTCSLRGGITSEPTAVTAHAHARRIRVCQHRHDLFSKLPIYSKKQWFDQQWKTICNIFSTAPWTCWLNWESAIAVPKTSLMYASVIQLSLCLIFIDSLHSSLWSIETVSADGRSARPARLGGHPIWWRWHGNTKSLSKVQSSDV